MSGTLLFQKIMFKKFSHEDVYSWFRSGSEMTCSCVMFSHVKKRKFGVCGTVQKVSEKKLRGNEDSDAADNENQDSGRTGAATTPVK